MISNREYFYIANNSYYVIWTKDAQAYKLNIVAECQAEKIFNGPLYSNYFSFL